MSSPEVESNKTITENIAPYGLGFGEGGISVAKQMEMGILTAEVPIHVHEVLTNDPNSFKKVETSDDGCGDGRPWIKVLRMVKSDSPHETIEYKRSLLRAKVFGGGLVVASSMWRTIKETSSDGQTLIDDRSFMAAKLAELGFEHGAHTDDHAEGDKCGCGAIDNYQLITGNAVKYREQITGALKVVYGDEYTDNQSEINQVFAVYENLANDEQYFTGISGKQAMDQIVESGAVVKQLHGHHLEDTVVINDIEGTTLDQQYFTQTVKDRCENKPQTVQAFVVDTWRGKQIAEIVTTVAGQTEPGSDMDHIGKIAYADFLIRTLAVAGTLTAGDLPVYRRRYL